MSLPANPFLKQIALYLDGCANLQHAIHSLTGVHCIALHANSLPYKSE